MASEFTIGITITSGMNPGFIRYRSQSHVVVFLLGLVRSAQLAESEIRRSTGFAELDWKRFERVADHIETLQPGFRPRGPRRLRLASQLMDYRNAEKLALRYRRTMKSAAAWVRGEPNLRQRTYAIYYWLVVSG
jgi:hypothetical protein